MLRPGKADGGRKKPEERRCKHERDQELSANYVDKHKCGTCCSFGGSGETNGHTGQQRAREQKRKKDQKFGHQIDAAEKISENQIRKDREDKKKSLREKSSPFSGDNSPGSEMRQRNEFQAFVVDFVSQRASTGRGNDQDQGQADNEPEKSGEKLELLGYSKRGRDQSSGCAKDHRDLKEKKRAEKDAAAHSLTEFFDENRTEPIARVSLRIFKTSDHFSVSFILKLVF